MTEALSPKGHWSTSGILEETNGSGSLSSGRRASFPMLEDLRIEGVLRKSFSGSIPSRTDAIDTDSVMPSQPQVLTYLTVQKQEEIFQLFSMVRGLFDGSGISENTVKNAFKRFNTKPHLRCVETVETYLASKGSSLQSLQQRYRKLIDSCSTLKEKTAALALIKACTHNISIADARELILVAEDYLTTEKYQLRLEGGRLHTGPITTLSECILSHIITEDETSETARYIRDVAIPFFCTHPEIQHIMQAYAKILTTQKGDIFLLNKLEQGEAIGYCGRHHSIFLLLGALPLYSETIVHEAFHAIFKHIYKNANRPYGATDEERKAMLTVALDADRALWKTERARATLSSDERYVLTLFNDYLLNNPLYFGEGGYDPTNPEHIAISHEEAIVCIMELRARGIPFSAIERWAPNLYKFYLEHCEGAIMAWTEDFALGDLRKPIVRDELSKMISAVTSQEDSLIKENSLRMILDLIGEDPALQEEFFPQISSCISTLMASLTRGDFLERMYQLSVIPDHKLIILQDLLREIQSREYDRPMPLIKRVYKLAGSSQHKNMILQTILTAVDKPSKKLDCLRMAYHLADTEDLKAAVSDTHKAQLATIMADFVLPHLAEAKREEICSIFRGLFDGSRIPEEEVERAFRWFNTKPHLPCVQTVETHLASKRSSLQSLQRRSREQMDSYSTLEGQIEAQALIKACTHNTYIADVHELALEADKYLKTKKYRWRLEGSRLHTGAITTLSTCILSHIFTEDETSEAARYIKGVAIPFFCTHPEIQHVMRAYAKILTTQKGDIFLLNKLAKAEGIGYYRGHHSILLLEDNICHYPEVIVREILHAVFMHIYKNASMPYGADDEDRKAMLTVAVDADCALWKTERTRATLSSDECYVLTLLADDLLNNPLYFGEGGYDPTNLKHVALLHKEVIVRIMELIARGIPLDAIERMAPNLYKYYLEHCKGAITAWTAAQVDLRNPL